MWKFAWFYLKLVGKTIDDSRACCVLSLLCGQVVQVEEVLSSRVLSLCLRLLRFLKGRWGNIRPFLEPGQFDILGYAENTVFCWFITPVEDMGNLSHEKRPSPGPNGITEAVLVS